MSKPPIDRVLYTDSQIRQKIAELGQQICRDYQGKNLHMVGVLRGALPFLADLARSLDLPNVTMDFLCVRRRLGSTPELLFDLDSSLAGRHVLLVEDLVSEGRTLAYLEKLLSVRQPASLKLCSLLRRDPSVELAYWGWDCQEEGYLVGYGLDIEERWRHLPYIAVAQHSSQ
jgi:hypoxanthine phosphoribosyltransferase